MSGRKRKYVKVSDQEKEWMKEKNVSLERFWQRVHKGMDRKEAATRPVRKKERITEDEHIERIKKGMSYGAYRVYKSRKKRCEKDD